ncbi:hypothetical protein A1O7_06336 [Cladophialophora yegresii CBS 114405]|uniref:Uncharacterized protein n=1 Tax=Cladophialophora yegresii CBS 114405 TaxID=1182544 RepID=W9W2Z5_9EURO|nr:uncharacterized protein A1O7_06336 [Cladophialophora yegresii CBS 114405]EXJ58906.1 hypothetical protein A1O7_06336 [Cladophialophora yegresii CBS 114405]
MASTPGNDVALRQSFSNVGLQSSSFSQQGSLDWVAFGRMQYSASIAVLGRLAGAGVDSLTVAFGQAMCSAIPLGIHGEKVLQDAMKRLTACSTFGDLVWFGVGVRHILRDLVQTRQGSALVALCGAMSEGYSSEVSALVLYEMSGSMGAPGELRPSFPQWHALAKVTASVFVEGTSGLRIRQFLRLSGLPQGRHKDPGHPADLAQVILAVGRLSSSAVETLYIQGGPACSWVAAFADWVLGLRVRLLSCKGDLISMNYDPALLNPQAVITFTLPDTGRSGIQCTGSTAAIRPGLNVIRDFFGISPDSLPTSANPTLFSGGRLEWATMLQDTFGPDFSELMGDSVHSGPDENQGPSSLSVDPDFQKHRSQLFARTLASGTFDILGDTIILHFHKSHAAFMLWLVKRLSELRPLTSILLEESVRITKKVAKFRWPNYDRNLQKLRRVCRCKAHRVQRIPQPGTTEFCLPAIAETVLRLSQLLSTSILHGDCRPSHCGLMTIYYEAAGQFRCGSAFKDPLASSRLLHMTFSLYAGAHSISFSDVACAYSDGNIFAYMGTLEKATDSVEEAVLIHVGVGAIQHGPAVYRTLSGIVPLESRQEYPVRHNRPTNGLADLNQDTTSRDLRLHAMVQQRFDGLTFWYRASSEHGMTTFSPLDMVERLIVARSYLRLVAERYPSVGVSRDDSIFGERYKYVVEGEGVVSSVLELMERGVFLLRPVRNNTLGRCVAIARSRFAVFLVKNDEELDIFFQYWTERFGAEGEGVDGREGNEDDDEGDKEGNNESEEGGNNEGDNAGQGEGDNEDHMSASSLESNFDWRMRGCCQIIS